MANAEADLSIFSFHRSVSSGKILARTCDINYQFLFYKFKKKHGLVSASKQGGTGHHYHLHMNFNSHKFQKMSNMIIFSEVWRCMDHNNDRSVITREAKDKSS